MEQPNDNQSRLTLILAAALAVVIIGAVVAIAIIKSGDSDRQAELDAARQEIEQLGLANQQLQLANEFEAINAEFKQYEGQANMLRDDSLTTKYNAAKQKVEKLLNELKNEKSKNAKNLSRIKELEGEIATLKGILRHYVAQIDSLSKENRNLRSENADIKSQNEKLTSRVEDANRRNEDLNKRMTLAEKLNVTGLSLQGLKKNGKSEKNITKATQLMVTFTIPQNNSTPPGMKTIYLRITTPEGQLLGGAGSFSFEGSRLSATAQKQIEYAGEEISGIRMYCDVNTTLTPGDYLVELFADNYRLASRRFTMKK